MADLLTTDQIREHIETDLPDDALQRLLDDADAEIIRRLGQLATATHVAPGAGARYIPLPRQAQSVTSVTLRIVQIDYPLGDLDYSLEYQGRMLERRPADSEDGSITLLPDIAWHGVVTIVYVPMDETARRTRLEIDLVRLAVNNIGWQSQKVGDASLVQLDFEKERNKLFAPFLTGGRAWII